MRHHVRHGFEGLQWIYHVLPVFAEFVMLETCGNVDILGLDIESSGLNSVILRLSGVQLPFPYVDIWKSSTISTMFFFGSHDRCLENPSLCYLMLLARAVCILVLVPEWSVQWYDLIQETDFSSLESYISKTIRPTWATSCLLLSSLRGCCVALSSVTTVYHVRLLWFFLMPRVSCTLVFTFFWNQGWRLWTSQAQNPMAV